MRKYILIIMAAVALSSCNDDFLEKAPVNSQTEESAFTTYDNCKTYAWSLYEVFTKSSLGSQGISAYSYKLSGDEKAGYMTTNSPTYENKYAYNSAQIPTTSASWDFTEIRRANLLIKNAPNSEISQSQRDHWIGVGKFFRAYNYIELTTQYGDVPWLDRPAESETDDEIVYAAQTPRVTVADNIIEDLKFAIEHIDNSLDGENTISADCARVLMSRYTLFEATWRKSRIGSKDAVDETNAVYKIDDLLSLGKTASEELMAAYPTIAKNFNEKYLTRHLSSNAKSIGVILYKEYVEGVLTNNNTRYLRNNATQYDAHQYIVDLYLCRDGKTIHNSDMYGGHNKSIFHEYKDRDYRLQMSFPPPYYEPALSKASSLKYDNPMLATDFPDLMCYKEQYDNLYSANEYWPTIPSGNWKAQKPSNPYNPAKLDALNFAVGPNIYDIASNNASSCSGYIFCRYYTYEDNRLNAQGYIDKPIFIIEEVMLNYAEIMYEMGQFTQNIADKTINELRERAGVADLVISDIDDSFDPVEADFTSNTGTRPAGVDPLKWEIIRERIIELMGEGFGFNDIRRWKLAPHFINRPVLGMYMRHSDYLNKNGTAVNGQMNIVSLTQDGGVTSSNAVQGKTEGHILINAAPAQAGHNGWEDAYYLLPVPREELLLNDALVQNPGWDALFPL